MQNDKTLIFSDDQKFITDLHKVYRLNESEVITLSIHEYSFSVSSLEVFFKTCWPTLIVINSSDLNIELFENFNEITGSVSLEILSCIDNLRVKYNHKCVISVYVRNISFELVDELNELGADCVHDINILSYDSFQADLNLSRKLISENNGSKLKILVAENHIYTFLQIQALLSDFCDVTLAVDSRNGNIRDCCRLSPISILNEVRANEYGAIIVDLALSPEQESKVHSLTSSPYEDNNSNSVFTVVAKQLYGLATIRMIRDEYKRIPVCVLSNYVFQENFLSAVRDILNPKYFDSVSFFTKDPDGRSNMRDWLCRLHN